MFEARTYLAAAAGVATRGDASISQQKLGSERQHVLLGQCLEFTRDIVQIGRQFSITIKLGNEFNFDFRNIIELELPSMMKQKKKPSPFTVKWNQLRMKTFIDKKKISVMENSPSVDADDTQDVTLAHKEVLGASTFKCDQCDFNTKTSFGLKLHVSKQHKISQLDGEPEVVSNELSDKHAEYEDQVILSMKDNGFSKLEMLDPDEPPPSEVVHPRLGIGRNPRVMICPEY